MWVAHGWVFMVYVVVAFLLARQAGWSSAFTLAGAGRRPDPAADLLGRAPGRRSGCAPSTPSSPLAPPSAVTTAFVLGGGGVLGAVEVGMLRALFERDIDPDLVLGTSVGALNGAMVARDPTLGRDRAAHRPVARRAATSREVYGDRPLRTVRRAVSTGTHIYSAEPLRQRLAEEFGDVTFEELPVRFQVCAASIERAAEHWFDSGPVVDAVVASAAVPGLLPPAEVGDEHFLDGGIVNSIPLGRAVAARRRPGSSCSRSAGSTGRSRCRSRPWEVARVSFEIARRHRFARELAELPDGVEAHVLPGARHVEPRRLAARPPRLLAACSSGSTRRYDASVGLPRRTLAVSRRDPGRLPAAAWSRRR